MKFNFRRIASVLASATMIASTVALAAAANYPAPFVSGGKANVAIVYGSQPAAVNDLAATNTISDSLAGFVTSSGSGGSSVALGGDYVMLEKSSNKFNLGKTTSQIYPKLTSDQLSVVLGDGTYRDSGDDNSDYDYTQELALGSLQLQWFEENDFNRDAPVIGFDIPSKTHIANYTLDFNNAVTGGANLANLDNTEITMLGKTFYISNAEFTSDGAAQLTMLDTANSVLVSSGTASTVVVGGKSYDVSIVFEDSANVILSVNGVQTNKLKQGATYNLGNDVYISVKNILYDQKESGISKAEVSIGSGKIVLTDGQEVQLNSKAISEFQDAKGYSYKVTAFITNTSNNLNKLVLSWDTDSKVYVAPGTDLVMPGFNTIKLSMGDFVTPSTPETVTVEPSSNSLTLTAPTTDSENTEVSLLYLNDANTAIAGIGKSADETLVTKSGTGDPVELILNSSTDTNFVGSWVSGQDSESYLFTFDTGTSSGDAVVKLKTESVSSVNIKAGDSKDFGDITVTVNTVDADTGMANITLSASGGGSAKVYADRLFTKKGLQIMLPVDSLTTAPGNGQNVINLSASPTSFNGINFTEQDNNQNVADGQSFYASVDIASDELSVPTISGTLSGKGMIEVGANSKKYTGYVESQLSTKIMQDKSGDQSTLELNYYGDETYGQVYVSEVSTAITQNSNSTGTNVLGSVTFKDSEIQSSDNRNWIVVGGSCVNSVAANLLGKSALTCGDAWQQTTGVGSGQFLIQTFARSNGKVATLVAGYDVTDTANAATALTTKTVDTTVGKKYTGGSDLTLTSSLA